MLTINYGVAVGSGVAAPPSAGSPAAGVVASGAGVSSGLSHAPRVAAKPNNKAKNLPQEKNSSK